MDKYEVDCLVIGGGVAGLASAKFLAQEFKKTYFGGGGFWCMEEAFDKVEGVTNVVSGYSGGASGPQTAAVVFGGGFPAVFTSSEYDGTNWTAGGTLPSSRGGYGTCGNTGNGSQTAAIGAGGYTPGPIYFNGSFIYDGTVFTTGPNISTARNELASGGPNSSFYITGGLTSPGAASNATEEFTGETSTGNITDFTTS